MLPLDRGAPAISPCYVFRSVGRRLEWPTQGGKGLDAVGAWNFLFRLGLQPRWIRTGDLASLSAGDVLLAAGGRTLTDERRRSLRGALDRGVRVIASGSLQDWTPLLGEGTVAETVCCEFPYAALGWIAEDDRPQIIAPSRWCFDRIRAGRELQPFGALVAVRGERQTPARALVTPLEAPAMVRAGNFYFLNGNPFAALQSWLQGQASLTPWLQWRHRLFWLDELVADIAALLWRHDALPPAARLDLLADTTVVLRHDLDHSRDTSYLDLERQEGIAAVHAILRDENTGFWLKALRNGDGHEVAFHYRTARYNRWVEGARARVGFTKRPFRPDRRAVAGEGLLRQVRWARRKHIGISTLHRHLPFLIYPEWVDAMHTVLEQEPRVLGGSSLFRGHVLRWGTDEADNGEFPDSQFPYWFPVKLAHAALGGVPLRGWESTSVMEVEPELFDQMLSHRIPGLRQRVVTVNYHPAHAQRDTFRRGGSLDWWRAILRVARDHGACVRTLSDVYRRADASLPAETPA